MRQALAASSLLDAPFLSYQSSALHFSYIFSSPNTAAAAINACLLEATGTQLLDSSDQQDCFTDLLMTEWLFLVVKLKLSSIYCSKQSCPVSWLLLLIIIIIADDVSAAVPSCTPHLLDSSKIDADWSVFTKGD